MRHIQFAIRLNTTCNLSCDHCYINNNSKFTENIIDDIIKFFDRIPDDLVDQSSIIFIGGEITLYPSAYIQRFVDYIKHRSKTVELDYCSNLTRNLNESDIHLIKSIGYVSTSFDNRIRFKTMKNLLTWKRNVQLLHDMQININLTLNMNKYTIMTSPRKFLQLANSLGINFIEINHFMNNSKFEQLYMCDELIDDWLCEFYIAAKKNKNVIVSYFEFLKKSIRDNGTIERNFQNCCKNKIIIDGDVIVDCLMDKNPTVFSLDSNIEDILSYKDQMKYIPPNYCLSCDKYDICGGGCPNYHIDGMKRCWIFPKLYNIIFGEVYEDGDSHS